MRICGIIVAAGSSSRMGGSRTKILERICGKAVIEHTLLAFDAAPSITDCIVVCREEELSRLEELLAGKLEKPFQFVLGGNTRQESVQKGISASGNCAYLAIHDGARPLVTPALIEAVCRDAKLHGASAAAVPVKDTCKLADGEHFVQSTPERSRLFAVQTPQVFRKDIYQAAMEEAFRKGMDFTDDCQLLEQAGYPVHLTRGDYQNIKITTAEDLISARGYLAKGSEAVRIGYGYDVHRLTENRKLILGGVEIPYEKGLLGHSDADVLCHAISDALLGAAAMGDIGKLFPDTDPRYQGADSLKLLGEVVRHLQKAGYEIGNIDATVAAQRPKLLPYILQMRENIARACAADLSRISVKATTEEGLGFTGREEGMSASAVVLLKWYEK